MLNTSYHESKQMNRIDQIQMAGTFLELELLKNSPVDYSKFYTSEPTPTAIACASMFIEEDVDDEWLIYTALDAAVSCLQDQGVVSVEELDNKLMDGENDYPISLTKPGREVIALTRPASAGPKYWVPSGY